MEKRDQAQEIVTGPVSWVGDSEPDAVSSLRGLGIENVEAAFRIDSETDNQGQQIESIADIYWVKFSPPKDFPDAPPVEGKLYLPKEVDGKPKTLIHYAASFPQGNAGRFEKHYVYDFLKDGNAFFAGRNNGASFVEKENFVPTEIINSSKRLEIAKKHKEQHIGGTKLGGYTPVEIGNQPITSLFALHAAFQKINLIAQSFGASSHNNAVTQLTKTHDEIISKIDVVVSIAGFVGIDAKDADGIRDGTKIPERELAQILNREIERSSFNFKGGVDGLESGMNEVAERNSQTKIPSHIGYVLFITPADHIVGPKDYGVESLKAYGPKLQRKVVVLDLRCSADDPRPHSMDWIKPEELLEAMRKRIPENGPHILTLNRGELFS